MSAAVEPVRRANRPRRRHPARCQATGKVRYRDGDDAGLALRSLSRRRAKADLDGGRHTIQVCRKYACDACGGWHLTSWLTPSTPPSPHGPAALLQNMIHPTTGWPQAA